MSVPHPENLVKGNHYRFAIDNGMAASHWLQGAFLGLTCNGRVLYVVVHGSGGWYRIPIKTITDCRAL